MPAGLIDGLLPDERFDLIKFLSQLGRPGDFDAAKGGVARVWSLYIVTSKNQEIRMERVVSGDPALDDWVPAISLVNGVLGGETITTAYPSFANTRGLYAATRFDSSAGGAVQFALAGGVKDAWLNGVHLKTAAQFTTHVRAGSNTLVLQLDEARVAAGVKLSAGEVSFTSN
jgi:hypothetical protein